MRQTAWLLLGVLLATPPLVAQQGGGEGRSDDAVGEAGRRAPLAIPDDLAPAVELTPPAGVAPSADSAPQVGSPSQAASSPPAVSPPLSETSPSAVSETAAGIPATGAGAARVSAGQRTATIDTLDLGTTSITGNQELPKVLYIVPWKSSDLGDVAGRPVNTLLDEVLSPIDHEVFGRQLDYFESLYGTTAEE